MVATVPATLPSKGANGDVLKQSQNPKKVSSKKSRNPLKLPLLRKHRTRKETTLARTLTELMPAHDLEGRPRTIPLVLLDTEGKPTERTIKVSEREYAALVADGKIEEGARP